MELGSQNRNRDGLLGPNSIMVVYMDFWGEEDPNANDGLLNLQHETSLHVKFPRFRREEFFEKSQGMMIWGSGFGVQGLGFRA